MEPGELSLCDLPPADWVPFRDVTRRSKPLDGLGVGARVGIVSTTAPAPTEEEKRRVAVHEAGHALVGEWVDPGVGGDGDRHAARAGDGRRAHEPVR